MRAHGSSIHMGWLSLVAVGVGTPPPPPKTGLDPTPRRESLNDFPVHPRLESAKTVGVVRSPEIIVAGLANERSWRRSTA